VIITAQKLIELAAEDVERRKADADLVAAYLVGSVVTGDPLLGGTADVDLVLVHRQEPSTEREFLTLSRDVHLDVAHHPMVRYGQPRRLRYDPWLGPSVREARVLYDPQHFIDWAVAGARGQFERADAVTARAEALLIVARRNAAAAASTQPWLGHYLRALVQACNAAAALVAPPACGRRASQTLEHRFITLGDPSLFEAYQSLHGATALSDQDVAKAISVWARAAEVLQAESQPALSEARAAYWLNGFRSLAEAGRPDAAVWPLLFTWETVLHPPGSGPRGSRIDADFAPVLERAALEDGQRDDRLLALEAFTDRIEGLVQAWASRQGA
jgi:predicted nucleotidyltransferase